MFREGNTSRGSGESGLFANNRADVKPNRKAYRTFTKKLKKKCASGLEKFTKFGTAMYREIPVIIEINLRDPTAENRGKPIR